MSLPARVTTLLVRVRRVVAAMRSSSPSTSSWATPPVVNYAPYASGGQVNVVMQTDPQNTVTSQPDWVSYFIQDPQNKQWVHTTYFEVPGQHQGQHDDLRLRRLHPAAQQRSGARSPGTIGERAQYNQHPARPTYSLLNSWSDCNVGHTFAIPGLGINVPIASPTTRATTNNNLCGTLAVHPAARTRW